MPAIQSISGESTVVQFINPICKYVYINASWFSKGYMLGLLNVLGFKSSSKYEVYKTDMFWPAWTGAMPEF